MEYLYQTPKQAGYRYCGSIGFGLHIVENSEGISEVWANSKHYAGYALIFKNTHLEFCRTASLEELELLNGHS